MTRRRRGVRPLLAVLLALAATLLGALPASAHAYLLRSDPADGAVLQQAPEAIHLSMSEHVVLGATRLSLVSGTGQVVRLGPATVAVEPAAEVEAEAGSEDTEEPMTVVVEVLSAMPKGTYRLSWESLSADDLHRTAGVLVFGVQEDVTAVGRSEQLPSGPESLLRWLALLGLSGAAGALLVPRLTGGSRSSAGHRIARLGGRVALAAAGAGAVLLLLQVLSAGEGRSEVLESRYAVSWATRTAGLVLLAVAARRIGRGRPAGRVAWVGAAAALVGTALVGHSGAGTAGPLRVGVDVVHLAAAATWSGGLGALALLAWWSRTDLPAAARRFAVPAGLSVAGLAVSGLLLAADSVASVDAVLTTAYGKVLLAKLTLAAVAGGLGLRHYRRARRGSVGARTVLAEAVVLGTVLLGSAVLASGQPAVGPDLVADPALRATVAVDRSVADLRERMVLQPGRPGPNIALVDVFDTRRPSPAPVRGVTLIRLGPGGEVLDARPGQALPDHRWSVPLDLPESGPVRFRLAVAREGLDPLTTDVRWVVGPAGGDPVPVVSLAPVGGWLRAAAGSLLLTLLAGTWLVRRRAATPEPATEGVKSLVGAQ